MKKILLIAGLLLIAAFSKGQDYCNLTTTDSGTVNDLIGKEDSLCTNGLKVMTVQQFFAFYGRRFGLLGIPFSDTSTFVATYNYVLTHIHDTAQNYLQRKDTNQKGNGITPFKAYSTYVPWLDTNNSTAGGLGTTTKITTTAGMYAYVGAKINTSTSGNIAYYNTATSITGSTYHSYVDGQYDLLNTTSNTGYHGFVNIQSSTNTAPAKTFWIKERGTLTSPTNVVNGDSGYYLSFHAYNGGTQPLAHIYGNILKISSTNTVAGNMQFAISSILSGKFTEMMLDSTGLKFNNALMPYYSGAYQPGTSGYVLTSQGAGVAPQWTTISSLAAADSSGGASKITGSSQFLTNYSGWGTKGNSGTTVGTNYLGTNDQQPLEFKVDGIKSGWIDDGGSSTLSNTSYGYQALLNIGTGNFNVAIGLDALELNNNGANNTAVGYSSLSANGSGGGNTAIGENSGTTNTGGANNTLIGYSADVASGSLSDATAVGYNASVASSDCITMGSVSVTQFQFNGALMPSDGLGGYNAGSLGQVLNSHGAGAPQWAASVGQISFTDSIALIALGNSLFQSNTSTTKNSFIWRWDSLMNRYNSSTGNWTQYNLGHDGFTTAQLCQIFYTLTSLHGTYALIGDATNDILQGLDSNTIRNYLQSQYDSAHNAGYIVIAVNNSPNDNYDANQNATRNKLNSWINHSSLNVNYVLNASTYLCDHADTTNLLAAFNTGDGTHYSKAGNDTLASVLRKTLGTNWINYNSITDLGKSKIGQDVSPSGNPSFYTVNGLSFGLGNGQDVNSVSIGSGALAAATGTGYNAGIGYEALYSTTTGTYNFAGGYKAGYNNTTGYDNVFFGAQAGLDNTIGYQNVAIGYNTLESNVKGIGCVGIGYNVLTNDTARLSYNTGVGFQALTANAGGVDNSAVGAHALQANTAGGQNTAIGFNALLTETTGSNNTAIGYDALDVGTGKTQDVGIGSFVLDAAGSENTAVGYQAGNVTTGGYNCFYGDGAGILNTSGLHNVMVGALSDHSNVAGVGITAVGYEALYSNTASNNTALGDSALVKLTTGTDDWAIGKNSGDSLTTQSHTGMLGSSTTTDIKINGSLDFKSANTYSGGSSGSVLVSQGTGTTPKYLAANVYNVTTASGGAGTTSSTAVMLGLAGAMTPASSGTIMITIDGLVSSSGISGASTVQIAYGTGTAPTLNAAATGTVKGSLLTCTSNAGGSYTPFSTTAIVTGLSSGTAYWIDLQYSNQSGATTVLSQITVTAAEIK